MVRGRWNALTLLAVGAGSLLLASCGDKGDKGDSDEDPSQDLDGDGYTQVEDCDDTSQAINPGVDEVCNGIDDDCDGAIDEEGAVGSSTWYADNDGDGYGDPNAPTEACSEPIAHTDDNTDCDDRDSEVYPAAEELCATVGVDDDCDGQIDEGDAADAGTYYSDADGDGYGDPDSEVGSCSVPDNGSEQAGDCDDTNAEVNPDGLEVCNGLDDDCDGTIDNSDAEDAQTWYQDGDGDGYGDADSSTTACDEPHGFSEDDTDCDDGDDDVNPGAPELCETEGVDDDCDGEIDEDDAADVSTWYADADGDGYGEAATTTEECTQPTGFVSDDTDCNDGDESIHPGATELCNNTDDDCDSSTTEGDVVTHWDSSGNATDYSSAFSGTSSAPAAVTLADDGELAICDGTYYVNIDAQADVALYGLSGSASDVVLNGGGSDAVITSYTDGLELSLADLTIEKGGGSALFYTSATTGGGIACYSSAVTTEITLDGVTIADNDADYGGGVWLYDCELTSTDSTIDSNSGEYGAGIALFGGDLSVQESELIDNEAETGGGAFYIQDVSGNGATASFRNIEVDSNEAYAGAGLVVYDAAIDMTGSSSSSGIGFTNNDDGFGALYIGEGGSIDFATTDTGTSSGGDDNDPADIYCETTGYAYLYEDDEDLICDESSCGTTSSVTLASADTTSDTESGARGNIFIAESAATIEDVYWPLATKNGNGCDVDFYLVSASSTSASSWTVEWQDSRTITNSSAQWYSSGGIGVPVEVGTTYGTLLGWDCSAYNDELEYIYDTSGSSTSDVDFATTKGRWLLSNGYSGYSTSASSGFDTQDFRYYSIVYWSH